MVHKSPNSVSHPAVVSANHLLSFTELLRHRSKLVRVLSRHFLRQLPAEHVSLLQLAQFARRSHPTQLPPRPGLQAQHAALLQGWPPQVHQQHPTVAARLQLLVLHAARLPTALPFAPLGLRQNAAHLPREDSVPAHHREARGPSAKRRATPLAAAEEGAVGREAVGHLPPRQEVLRPPQAHARSAVLRGRGRRVRPGGRRRPRRVGSRQVGGVHRPQAERLRYGPVRAARGDAEAQPVREAGLIQEAGSCAGGELRRARREKQCSRYEHGGYACASGAATATQDGLDPQPAEEWQRGGAGGASGAQVHAGAPDRRAGLDGERAGRVGALLRR